MHGVTFVRVLYVENDSLFEFIYIIFNMELKLIKQYYLILNTNNFFIFMPIKINLGEKFKILS